MENHSIDININNLINVKNIPEKGCFLALKVPGVANRSLPRSVTVVLYLLHLPPHFDRVLEKNG